jgi:hypothetical protein
MTCSKCGSSVEADSRFCDNCGGALSSAVGSSGGGGGTAVAMQAVPAAIQVSDSYITTAMDRWSGAFTKLMLPSGLGSKAIIKHCADEGAKVLSMGVYMGYRTAEIDSVPYDGSTYEGHTIKDESTGTLWAYETNLPDGFEPKQGERFLVSLGHVFKCPDCRGQGRVRCSTCNGRVRWHEKNWKDEIVEKVCSCGDGRMDCPACTGYGTQLKVLRVQTKYSFEEKKEKEYSGRLPEQHLMGSVGNGVYRHVADFETRVIAEAIDGFEPDEFTRLMNDVHAELKTDVSQKVAGQMVNPQILNGLIDGYFRGLPNPVAANKRLKEEVLPVRMKCEVTDVPVKAVRYEYKGRDYALYVYGNDGKVWVDGDKPSEFTWKAGVVLGLIAVVILIIVLASR